MTHTHLQVFMTNSLAVQTGSEPAVVSLGVVIVIMGLVIGILAVVLFVKLNAWRSKKNNNNARRRYTF